MNIVMLAFLIGKAKNGVVSEVLLIIFGANMALYAIYYVGMKYYYAIQKKTHSETISTTCKIYIILATIFSLSALYYFKYLAQEKTTTVSPSQSRHLNRDCEILFFDRHDIWHFASGLGLLFVFMTLLTLEDNNTVTPWREIHVF